MSKRGLIALAAGAVMAAAAAPAQAAPQVALRAEGVQAFEGGLVGLAGQRVGVVARVAGAPAGSTLQLTWFVRGRTARTSRFTVSDSSEVRDVLRVGRPGTLVVRASLPGVGGSSADSAQPVRVTALMPAARLGDRGLRVRFLQRRLAALHYAVPVTGAYDVKTQFAVVAFRKANRMARVASADRRVFSLVSRGKGAYVARFARAGRHVEFDRTRQVLALVRPGGHVVRVFHSSSGRPRFRTPLGSFRFWRKEPGLNSREMLHTVYFTHDKRSKPTRPACGIHGYFAVPTYPYSHCCLRVGLWDALYIRRWIHIGERVRIYA